MTDKLDRIEDEMDIDTLAKAMMAAGDPKDVDRLFTALCDLVSSDDFPVEATVPALVGLVGFVCRAGSRENWGRARRRAKVVWKMTTTLIDAHERMSKGLPPIAEYPIIDRGIA